MRNGRRFKTDRFNENALRTFGRMDETTLRRTGLEDVLRKATERNLAALEKKMGASEFRKLKEVCSPEEIFREVRKRGLDDREKTKEIIGMSLGNPNAYDDYQVNMRINECLAELPFEDSHTVRKMAGYAGSFGFGPLVESLKHINFSNPRSVCSDPEKFRDVRVYITAGASQAAELIMGPAVLKPEDTVVVHDWIYIIHLGAAYFRNAHIESYECRDDGRPDSESLHKVLSMYSERADRKIQAVVFTSIGNPVGSAMAEEDIVDHLKIIGECSRKENRPVIAVIDVAYEAFRRGGKPLDPIEIAIDRELPVALAVLDTSSKGYGTCGYRLGKLALYWPDNFFNDYRDDYITALNNKILPTLGPTAVPLQMVYHNFFQKLREDEKLMKETVEFFRSRRENINRNLVYMAEELRRIPGVYLAKYYDHAGKNGGLDPETLSSFYLLFGFSKLNERDGSGFNQAVAFGEFALETPSAPLINCVPGQSFLPEKRWAKHPALIRVTGLTNREETEAFLSAVRAYGEYLK